MKKSAVISVFFLISLIAAGQDARMMEKTAHDSYQAILKETDKDKDGKISKKEFYAIWKDPKIAEEKYKAWDTNKDGYITEDEYVKAILDMGKKKK
jgi:hypothetical protein